MQQNKRFSLQQNYNLGDSFSSETMNRIIRSHFNTGEEPICWEIFIKEASSHYYLIVSSAVLLLCISKY